MSDKMLSLLIVTYNRSGFLQHCLAKICAQVASLNGLSVEVVVSDNSSTDDTLRVVERFVGSDGVRYTCTPEHYHSAEENLFFGLEACSGQYVWPFGDDDFLAEGSLNRIAKIIENGMQDFILINPSLVGTDGRFVTKRLVPMSAPSLVMSIKQMCQLVGITTVLASFSSVIFQRKALSKVDYKELLRISPIYAHVVAYLIAFDDKKCLLLNEPLVSLRTGTGVEAFERFALKSNRPMFEPWTTGLLNLVGYAKRHIKIPDDFIFHTLECGGGQRYWTWCRIIECYIKQLELSLESKNQIDLVSIADFSDFFALMSSGDGFSTELLNQMQETVGKIDLLNKLVAFFSDPESFALSGLRLNLLAQPTKDKIIGELRQDITDELSRARQKAAERLNAIDLFGLPIIAEVGDYKIYQVSMYFVAARDSFDLSQLDIGLADLEGQPPTLLCARNLPDLKAAIKEDTAIKPSDLVDSRKVRLAGAAEVINSIFDASFYRMDQPKNWFRKPRVQSMLMSGVKCGHRPNAFFDPAWYAQRYLGSSDRSADAIMHYAEEGFAQHNSPSPFFDEEWYLTRYSEVRVLIRQGAFVSGLHHFLKLGRVSLYDPLPVFSSSWYGARYDQSLRSVEKSDHGSVYEYFLKVGMYARHRPHPRFDEQRYLEINRDVAAAVNEGSVASGWTHYVTHGRSEGRLF